MTVTDPWGMPLSCAAEVAPTYGAAMRAYHDHRSGPVELLQQVVEADPGFAVARATAAYWAMAQGAPFDAPAEVAAAREGRAEHDWERSFVAATAVSVEQGRWAAQDRWLEHHEAYPGDLMGMFVATFLLVMGAEPDVDDEIDRRIRRSIDAVGEDPFLVGLVAMGLQDRGELDEARRWAERSLELDPTGFSGGHPLAHVYFEAGDHATGAAWLDGWLPDTDQEAMFGRHLVWHSALHHLALGDGEAALERYPRCGGSDAGGRLIDGPSLLWRCQLQGHVPPGTDPVTPPVGELARGFMEGVPFTFLGVHAALALATAGDADGLRHLAHRAREFTAPGAAEILPGLAAGLAAYVEGEPGRAADALLPLERRLWHVGGSHAQREVFEDTLIHALVKAQRYDEASTRLRARLDRRESLLDSTLLAETVSGGRDRLTP